MPQLYCNIPKGVPQEKKKQMVREIIKVTHEAVGSDPTIINVVVYEIEPSNMAVNGKI